MSNRYHLYGRKNSGSFAVEVALDEIGAPFDVTWIGSEEAQVAAYRAVCPTGRVPALALPDGTVMFESAAMLIHLALMHPDAGLAPPPRTTGHARFLQWMVFLSANLYETVLRIYYPDRYSARGAVDAAAVRDGGLQEFRRHLTVLSRDLGPYVLGAEYSIADVYLYMLVSWYPGAKDSIFPEFPALALHAERISAREAVAKVEVGHAG